MAAVFPDSGFCLTKYVRSSVIHAFNFEPWIVLDDERGSGDSELMSRCFRAVFSRTYFFHGLNRTLSLAVNHYLSGTSDSPWYSNCPSEKAFTDDSDQQSLFNTCDYFLPKRMVTSLSSGLSIARGISGLNWILSHLLTIQDYRSLIQDFVTHANLFLIFESLKGQLFEVKLFLRSIGPFPQNTFRSSKSRLAWQKIMHYLITQNNRTTVLEEFKFNNRKQSWGDEPYEFLRGFSVNGDRWRRGRWRWREWR
jgi:hypothetical protein